MLLLAAVGAALYYYRELSRPPVVPTPQIPPGPVQPDLVSPWHLAPKKPPELRDVAVPLRPMIELDFRPRAEIFALREGFVRSDGALVGIHGGYRPSIAVFGQVADKRPWWGIVGLYFNTGGKSSIAGPSEETRFIANPLLLVGVIERWAWRVKRVPPHPQPFYPRPLRLVWYEDGKRQARVTYDVGRYFGGLARRAYKAGAWDLTLVAYNARDLGLKYSRVDARRSYGLHQHAPSATPTRISQFIHLGLSCGYPGGCNNMSPFQPDLELRVDRLPASVWIDLWSSAPGGRPADFSFVIDLY